MGRTGGADVRASNQFTPASVMVIVLAALLAACSGGGSSSPTAPTGTGGTATGGGGTATTPVATTQSCRTFASAYTTVTTSVQFTSTIAGTCGFDTATNQATCVNRYTDTLGGSGTSTSVTSYLSRGDAVDEVAVIPPLRRSTGTTTTGTGSIAGTSNLTNSYDGQRRLTREDGSGYVTTYTAWDASGRPTSATSVNAGQTLALAMTYNDTARSLVTMTTTGGGSQSCSSTFDATGTNVSNVCGSGATQVTATTTVQATQQVCR